MLGPRVPPGPFPLCLSDLQHKKLPLRVPLTSEGFFKRLSKDVRPLAIFSPRHSFHACDQLVCDRCISDSGVAFFRHYNPVSRVVDCVFQTITSLFELESLSLECNVRQSEAHQFSGRFIDGLFISSHRNQKSPHVVYSVCSLTARPFPVAELAVDCVVLHLRHLSAG